MQKTAVARDSLQKERFLALMVYSFQISSGERNHRGPYPFTRFISSLYPWQGVAKACDPHALVDGLQYRVSQASHPLTVAAPLRLRSAYLD